MLRCHKQIFDIISQICKNDEKNALFRTPMSPLFYFVFASSFPIIYIGLGFHLILYVIRQCWEEVDTSNAATTHIVVVLFCFFFLIIALSHLSVSLYCSLPTPWAG